MQAVHGARRRRRQDVARPPVWARGSRGGRVPRVWANAPCQRAPFSIGPLEAWVEPVALQLLDTGQQVRDPLPGTLHSSAVAFACRLAPLAALGLAGVRSERSYS